MADFPENLYYTKEHEWIRIGDDGIGVLGITSFAVEQLGDVTMLELPEVGDSIAKGDAFGVVESVKAVSDLFAPVSGTVVKVNSGLDDSPENVNDAPYAEGWLIEIELSNVGEKDELMDVAAYSAFVAEQD